MINSRPNTIALVGYLCLLALGFLAAAATEAATFNLNVVDNDGNPVQGFRWILEEDKTFPVDPHNPVDLLAPGAADELLATGFHVSYHPVAQNGNTDSASTPITVPNVQGANEVGRFYVSVLPYSGYGISGKPVRIVNGSMQDDVTVVVQKHPIPTASITIFLFHDNWPINGAPDLPEEEASPLPDGTLPDWTQFSILLEEPAGRYGIAGGQVIADAYGNPLGTSYVQGCDANGQPDFDPNTNYGCFDLDGNAIIDVLGDGTIHPDVNGFVTIRNLAPGKYGIVAIPPTGGNWKQTSTIEGSPVIDAWVKANEPPFFVEFGPPGPHVFIGFIKSTLDGGFQPLDVRYGAGGATISGDITDMHLSRPPATTMYSGRPFPGCWVALNEGTAGAPAPGIYAAPCAEDSSFSIANVPPGGYQLKVFDDALDAVIATMGITVADDGLGGYDCNNTGGCEFSTANNNPIGVFNWFARLNTGIFNDDDQDGFWDAIEAGIGPESQGVNIRWPDGTIYQGFPTDGEGFAPFDEVFPFFHWLVAEVSFANKKATGATFVVDAGGPVDTTVDTFPGYGELNPQPQAENGGLPYRTETGQVLTTGFQAFLGQTNVMHFGKTDYLTLFNGKYVGENGGISGIVYNSVTRAEDDPELAAAEEWEAGVPRVQLALYADGDIDSFPLGDFPNLGPDMMPGTPDDTYGDVDWNGNGVRDLDDDMIDDVNNVAGIQLADVDNYPFDWYCQGETPCDGTMGPEDVENSGTDGIFDLGDAVQVTWTDSWDDNLPTGCQGANNTPASTVIPAISDDRCFDGLRNFNQVRPGVFDGGFAFADYNLDYLTTVRPAVAQAINNYLTNADSTVRAVDAAKADALQLGLIPGDYIVEAATPPGYKLMKEEDKNVDFGDEYIPSPAAFAATCVGDLRTVPPYFSMTTRDGSGSALQLIPGIDPADAAAPYAGEERPLCDRKKVPLSAAQNAGAEFWVMTDVPKAGKVTGVMLNDLANEFNPNSLSFGEKFAPPLLPVAFYDWNGKLVNRVYGDVYGRYNLLVPSTYSANLPQPSGMSPNMLVSCMNDAGPIRNPKYNPNNDNDMDGIDANGNVRTIIDPFFDPQYSQFCYTFQYMPGATTYLDTPVVSVASFTTPGAFPVDCERPDDTPMIRLVTRTDYTGPFVVPGDQIRIESMGVVDVPDPEWDGVDLRDKTITRDYRFSPNKGQVFLEDAAGVRMQVPSNLVNWGRNFITATINAAAGDYQVVVVNSAQSGAAESPIGVTLTVGTESDVVHRVSPALYPATPIQDAIDAAEPGELILVEPGTYEELVIVWKPVKLQGWGAGAVFLNARQVPTEKVNHWRTKSATLVSNSDIDQLPGQEFGVPGFAPLNEVLFPTEEGVGIFVAGKAAGGNTFANNPGARIDGFTIVGASTGGGIVVNGYNQGLSIGNNRLTANAGTFGGGIRVGHPTLTDEDGLTYIDAHNDDIRIHHNHIAKNGGMGGVGAGISLNPGSDNYRVQENWVCGNFTQGDGAGIGHLGVSEGGLIEDNTIIFNESFAQAGPQSGGGIFVGGQAPLLGMDATPGTGSVTIDANLIRGNAAGAGDGGGIRIANANGQDVFDNDADPTQWHAVNVFNNMITNNVAGLSGGGISLQDALRVSIRNNTVANNDATATTAEAVAGNRSEPHPAGIVSHVHSGTLAAAAGAGFSDPELSDNIVYQNRSFYWLNFDDPTTAIIETGLYPAHCPPVDLGGGLFAPPAACDLADVNAYSDDLAVVETADLLNPQTSLLTNNANNAPYLVAPSTNITGDPMFVNGIFNFARRDNLNIPEFTVLQTAGAFDEGGNFIQVDFRPLSLVDPNAGIQDPPLYDYHLGQGSAALGGAGDILLTDSPLLLDDFDDDTRPNGGNNDIGADEAE